MVTIAGEATIGAWKKMFLRNKAAAFIMMTFVGALQMHMLKQENVKKMGTRLALVLSGYILVMSQPFCFTISGKDNTNSIYSQRAVIFINRGISSRVPF